MRARYWVLGVLLVLGLLGACAAWLAHTARGAYAELTAARDDLQVAASAVAERDAQAAESSTSAASEHAAAAARLTSGPVWDLAAIVPKYGAAPAAAQAIAASLDQALGAISPAVADLAELTTGTLIDSRGRINVAAATEALPSLRTARIGVTTALGTLSAAPTAAEGAFVPAEVDSARAELAEQLESLSGELDTLLATSEIVPGLLGADGTKRYFVGILNPNEARGTGGFLGTWAILKARAGRISVTQVGSNEDLPSLAELPAELGEEFLARYGDDAGEVGNMNLSPHFPNAAQLWLASWEERTGQELDGAISADVVALGRLIDAVGGEVQLPEGGTISGEQLTQLALVDIYTRFPGDAESAARSVYQEAVTRSAFDELSGSLGEDPLALASSLGRAISERRVQAWVRDPGLEERILDTPLGGSLAVEDGPSVSFVALNSSASKLDTWLTRSVQYVAGTCADDDGMAVSRFTVTLASDLPEGGALPPYVVSQAEVGPTGPINSTLAQVHLPNGAKILTVEVNGKDAFHSPFTEQGRPSTVLEITLKPQKERTLEVTFLEPVPAGDADEVVPSAPAQPLARDPQTTVRTQGC